MVRGGVGKRAIWEETLCLRFAWNQCGQILLPCSNKKQQKVSCFAVTRKRLILLEKVTILRIFAKFTIFDSWVSWTSNIKRLQHILWAPMCSKGAQTTEEKKHLCANFCKPNQCGQLFPKYDKYLNKIKTFSKRAKSVRQNYCQNYLHHLKEKKRKEEKSSSWRCCSHPIHIHRLQGRLCNPPPSPRWHPPNTYLLWVVTFSTTS